MPYLNAVIKEVLRIKPSAPGASKRILLEDRTLTYKDNKGKERTISLKAGQLVLCSIYIAHFHPDNWKDPLVFMPDRFFLENSYYNPNPFAYLPFFSGPRKCIGEKLALSEAKHIVVSVVQRFKFTIVPSMIF